MTRMSCEDKGEKSEQEKQEEKKKKLGICTVERRRRSICRRKEKNRFYRFTTYSTEQKFGSLSASGLIIITRN